jgi:hypothetical protein
MSPSAALMSIRNQHQVDRALALSQPLPLDKKVRGRALDYFGWMLRARQKYGKSVGSMIAEIYRVSRRRQRLSPKEYFFYHLFDDARYTREARETFVGSKAMAELAAKLRSPWPAIANDKPTLTALLRGHDLPVPETQAIRHDRRTFPGAVTLRSADELARFIRSGARFPMFSKPTNTANSLGVVDIDRYDAAGDCLVLGNGSRVALGDYVEKVEDYAEKGYMLQTRLVPHAEIAKVVGARVGTVRMVVLNEECGPTLLRAAWKIPVGDNVADNFWRPGNLLGGLDVDTGRILRVMRQGPNGFEQVDRHPDSGVKFDELTFPAWPAMRRVVLAAANTMPTCHLQGWDVAMCESGPVLVELEGDGGDPIMSQACFDTGLFATRLGQFVKEAESKANRGAREAKARRRAEVLEHVQQIGHGFRTMSTGRREPAAAEGDASRTR